MADLEANFMHLQLLNESLNRFNECFGGFLYGLNMSAFCVDFPEVRRDISLRVREAFLRRSHTELVERLTPAPTGPNTAVLCTRPHHVLRLPSYAQNGLANRSARRRCDFPHFRYNLRRTPTHYVQAAEQV